MNNKVKNQNVTIAPIEDRFLKYVSIETTADENNAEAVGPSSEKEWNLANLLMEELKEFNPDELSINEYATIRAYFKGSIEKELESKHIDVKSDKDFYNKNCICLLAHMDTSPSCSGKDVNPRIIRNYDGKDVVLNPEVIMKVSEFTTLNRNVGHDIIVTDGTTLLGGDDKAGIAIIMDLLSSLKDHRGSKSIEVIFTTDEEIGIDSEHITMKDVKSKFGYTIDGGDILFIENENFNGKSMEVVVKGKSIHPGSAKNKMVNAINVAIRFHSMLNPTFRPEHTSDREGFYHLMAFNGNEEETKLNYIVRDFDRFTLDKMINLALESAKLINMEYSSSTSSSNEEPVVTVKVKEGYSNMKEAIDKFPFAMTLVEEVYKDLNVNYLHDSIRGGTTGAHLAFMGLVTPNLGTGTYNMHGKYEYVDLDQMKQMVKILTALVNRRD